MNRAARIFRDPWPDGGGSETKLTRETRNRRMAVLCLEAAAEAETALMRAFLQRLAATLIYPRPANGIRCTQPSTREPSRSTQMLAILLSIPAAAGAGPQTIQRWRAAQGISSREERAEHRSRDRDLRAFLTVTMERRR